MHWFSALLFFVLSKSRSTIRYLTFCCCFLGWIRRIIQNDSHLTHIHWTNTPKLIKKKKYYPSLFHWKYNKWFCLNSPLFLFLSPPIFIFRSTFYLYLFHIFLPTMFFSFRFFYVIYRCLFACVADYLIHCNCTENITANNGRYVR